jgi:hypothetical protein
MFRILIVLAALALSGCATYSNTYHGERQAVYRDGSYYSPSSDGYGDYYYAPEYRYHDDYFGYHDPYGYGSFGYGNPYGYGSRWCTLRYRPCPGYWRSGWGLSLFFGNGWGWNRLPHYYDGGHHWRDRNRDRDWDRRRGHDDDNDNDHVGDRNRRTPDPGLLVPEPRDNLRGPGTRVPGEDRNRRIRDDRYESAPPRLVRGEPMPRGDVNARPEPDANARPEPAPRAEAPREREERRSDSDRPEPRRSRNESSDTRRGGLRRGDDD